jgi:N-methylhydantoinase B
VSSGNVETSQRIADVIFKAMFEASSGAVGAQSQGTMNNIIIGGKDGTGRAFTYYETIGGGEGGRPDRDGMDGVHTNMTNTSNTPVEALELAYPMRVERYSLVPGSGGEGAHRGGHGIVRSLKLLGPSGTLSIQSERRRRPPSGVLGGKDGLCGRNILYRASDGKAIDLGSKVTVRLARGDVVEIRTPGGGGHGAPGLVSRSRSKVDNNII